MILRYKIFLDDYKFQKLSICLGDERGQNVGIYFIFKTEGDQDLTAMFCLHLKQL